MPETFQIDSRHVRRQFERAASRYEEADVLARESATQMAERLAGINLEAHHVLDLGCGIGRDLDTLASTYPTARITAIDVAHAMVRRIKPASGLLTRLLRKRQAVDRIVASADRLPLTAGSVDMVWSNLMLNWLDDPAPALREVHRVMRVGGMVMFSTLGPDTLKELRTALGDAGADHVHPFIDMHDIGDALVKAGFADPVMDMDTLTLTYGEFDGLIQDLRLSGSINAARHRSQGLGRRSVWQNARERYERLRVDGRLPATFEVVYGHAWKPEPRALDDGREIIRFQPYPGRKA